MKVDSKSIKNLNIKNVEKVGWSIANDTKGRNKGHFDNNFSFAYAAYITQIEECKTEDEILKALEKNLEQDELTFIRENIGDNLDLVLNISNKISNKELLAYIMNFLVSAEKYGMEHTTPDSIIKLSLNLLQINNKDSVADFGCGFGKFLVEAMMSSKANYYGNEINQSAAMIAKIKCKLLDEDVKIEQGNMFDSVDKMKFDKIFSNYPFGIRLKDLNIETDGLNKLIKELPDIKKATSSDWIFNYLLVNCLNEKGKAVTIMPNGGTWNITDKSIREYFVKNGFIECVISLPERMFETTFIQTTLIVLSKGNKSIKMVDAHDTFVKGRRQNSFSEEDIKKIVSWVNSEGDHSRTVTYEELAENEFVINPTKYLMDEMDIEDAVDFSEVIKSVTRGAQLKANELDELTSQEPTSMQYLMLSNIQEGLIDGELPYLNKIDESYEKYCIKDGDMLLSKNGSPFKIAVAEIEEGKKILGNGNLYIIELDKQKINPYFLKAFFESSVGMKSLNNISVGAAIPNISLASLNKMKVPMPSLEKQNVIAEKYKAKMNEIKALKKQLVKAENELKNVFNEAQ